MKNFGDFTNKYPLSKTLCFELKPIGKTLQNIETKGLIEQDTNIASSSLKMKKTIDEYHKYLINKVLKETKLTISTLQEYFSFYSKTKEEKKEETVKRDFTKIKSELRNEIAKSFTDGLYKEEFLRLFQNKLIKEDLEIWIEGSNEGKDLYFDEQFKKFTTYFKGFNENRKNMYSNKEQSTSIAYRIIHENLPKFIDNINLYQAIKEKSIELDFSPILIELEEVIQGQSLDEIFTLEYFNNLLSQNGIDFINDIIGGKTNSDGKKIKGLNEYINLYNQLQKDKSKRVPRFKQLYKQILSDNSSISFLPDKFSNDTELFESIEKYYQGLCNFNINNVKNIFTELKSLLNDIKSHNIDKIYLKNDTNLTSISQRIFGSYDIFKDAISYYYDNFVDSDYQNKYNKAKSDKQRVTLEKSKKKWNKDYISIGLLQKTLDAYAITLDKDDNVKKYYSETVIADYFITHLKTKLSDGRDIDIIYNIEQKYQAIKGILNIDSKNAKTLIQDKDKVEQIKAFLESIKELNHFIKPLNITADTNLEKDELFYSHFIQLYEQLNLLIPLYNMVRNYLTQKPYSTDKIKLNFENSTLLDGWDVNKETDNTSVILRENDLYYLAIMDKKHNKVFLDAPESEDKNNSFEKMNYKLLPLVNQQLPRVFFAKSNIEYFKPSQEILDNYAKETHTKGNNFNIKDCHALIDFFKASLKKHEDWKHFNFSFSPTSSYKDISDFYREVEHQGYKISFKNIPTDYINKMVDEGKLYLFQIYNKDFSTYSSGTPSIHTLYWKMLFDKRNLENVIYKLNGKAEIFFRKASIEKKITHPANKPIENKNPLNQKKQSNFKYDIIKDKRYTIDKFEFHVPIILNFKTNGSGKLNNDVNKFLKNNPDVYIIGLDRGERNLIYLTLINQQGNIIEQKSLNIINNVNYHLLLDKKENERDDNRKSWGTIEKIKDLKEGYISQVVNEIATMMVKYNAIIVMEDLNRKFIQRRGKFEKQVYQKLEGMLINKFNYLVFKKYEPSQPGGILNALQLTNNFESFEKLGKQSGFLFYVPAEYTSTIDPVTCFVDFLKPKYETIEKAKSFFSKFDSIKYNKEKDYFEFSFDYNNFTTKAEGTKTKWSVCTYGKERYYYNVSKKSSIKINITEKLKELFKKENIAFETEENIKSKIQFLENKLFFISLIKYLSITLGMRYSSKEDKRDFILSPVANENGVFFYSETCDETLPKDADANGSYHIALKGLWNLMKINSTEDLENIKLSISNKEWLKFAQDKLFKK